MNKSMKDIGETKKILEELKLVLKDQFNVKS